jgi:hypothetical protein
MKCNRIILLIFTVCVLYILTIDVLFVNVPAYSTTLYRMGKVILGLAYSLTASSIFYYIAVYLPDVYLKRKFVSSMYRRTNLINDQVRDLFYYMGIDTNSGDYESVYKELEKRTREINPDHAINEYPDWYQYFSAFKADISDLIRSITVYHVYLDKDYLNELTLIEDQLASKINFGGYKQLAINNLSYASLGLHEIYVHNHILKQINQKLYERYKTLIDKEAKKYRKNNYDRKTLNSYD